ncbi:hypothetical protein N9H39_11615 [Gammaproteobacteria bacterium]|nr:hypothetical protein [Gammaproteobacteria bacterium]
MKPRTLLILITATALYACQTYVSNLAIEPSFTYQAMTGGGMVVGGVSSDLENLGAKRANRYADEIKMAVEQERTELVVIDTDSLRKKMESATYQAMMAEWTDGLVISKQTIAAVRKAVPNIKSASFARIEETSTRVSNTENPIYENIDDKKKLIGVTHNLAAMREITVTYIVYELASGAKVWSGIVPVTETESTTQWHMYGGPKTYTLEYPKFPSVEEAFATASRGFAKNLPKKK